MKVETFFFTGPVPKRGHAVEVDVDAVEVIDVDAAAEFARKACSQFIDIEAEAGVGDSEESSDGDWVIGTSRSCTFHSNVNDWIAFNKFSMHTLTDLIDPDEDDDNVDAELRLKLTGQDKRSDTHDVGDHAVEVIDVDAEFARIACSRFIDIEAEAGDGDSEVRMGFG